MAQDGLQHGRATGAIAHSVWHALLRRVKPVTQLPAATHFGAAGAPYVPQPRALQRDHAVCAAPQRDVRSAALMELYHCLLPCC